MCFVFVLITFGFIDEKKLNDKTLETTTTRHLEGFRTKLRDESSEPSTTVGALAWVITLVHTASRTLHSVIA